MERRDFLGLCGASGVAATAGLLLSQSAAVKAAETPLSKPASTISQALELLIALSEEITAAKALPRGTARRILIHIRNVTTPGVIQIIRDEVSAMPPEDSEVINPFVDALEASVLSAISGLLKIPDKLLDGAFRLERAIFDLARVVVANTNLLRSNLTDRTTPEGVVVGWFGQYIWDLLNDLLGSIPGLGDIWKQLGGATHTALHAGTSVTT